MPPDSMLGPARDDTQLSIILNKYGPAAFRRSSALDNFDEFLRRANISGDTCLEIGSYNGITAVLLSRYFKKVVSIDIMPRDIKHEILRLLGIDNVEFIDIKDNREKKEIVSAMDFDCCYMDGNHADDTSLDWQLVKRCKRVIFHEYHDRQRPTVDLVDSLDQSNIFQWGKFAVWNER